MAPFTRQKAARRVEDSTSTAFLLASPLSIPHIDVPEDFRPTRPLARESSETSDLPLNSSPRGFTTPPGIEMEFYDSDKISHTVETVHPYLKGDLKDAKAVSVTSWIHAISGRSPEQFDEWTRCIRDMRMFYDDIVQQSLIRFSIATSEKRRYHPLIDLCNRLVELARGRLPGLQEKYPVDDFCFASCWNKPVARIEEHVGLGAIRKPDVVGVRRKHATELKKEGGAVRWVDLLLAMEVKYRNKLVKALNTERKRRGLASVDSLGETHGIEVYHSHHWRRP